MVIQLNDMTALTSPDRVKLSTLTSTVYPEQDTDVVGKKMHLGYINSNTGYRATRLWINPKTHPDFEGENINSEVEELWTIVRFDKIPREEATVEEDIPDEEEDTEEKSEYPRDGVAILISPIKNKVIFTSTKTIESLRYHPGYILKPDELLLPFCDTWEEFNMLYKNEKIFLYQVQNQCYLRRPVVTEYWQDILTYDSYVNRMSEIPEDQHISKLDIVETLREHDPEKYKLTPDCILLSFPAYHPRHEHHLLDIPRRSINAGVVIRCDERDGVVVVLEFDESGNRRYVTDSECFIYYDIASESIPAEDYDELFKRSR